MRVHRTPCPDCAPSAPCAQFRFVLAEEEAEFDAADSIDRLRLAGQRNRALRPASGVSTFHRWDPWPSTGGALRDDPARNWE